MNIGIDIDDTITDTFDYLMPYVAEYFGADPSELKAKNISYSNMPEEWAAREVGFAKKYYDEIIPNTPVKPDAAKYITALKKAGHGIYIITARNNDLYTDAYKTAATQLKKYGIPYDKLLCTFDKARACVEEHIGLFIDDSVGNCRKVRDAGISVFLFGSKGNRHRGAEFQRVGSWKEVYERIQGGNF